MRVFIWIFAALLTVAAASNKKNIVCYFGSWAVYRPGNGKIDIPDIDPTLCTHLIYTFVGLNGDGTIKIIDPWADLPDGGGKDGYNRFNRLRNLNPNAKTLIAIGGWNEGSVIYSRVVGNAKLRRSFVNNAVKFVQKYNFDGLDFDWEYPNQRGGKQTDKKNFVLLLKALKTAFKKNGLLLSAAVGAAPHSASQSYNVPEIVKHLDIVNLMTYDFHGSWETNTGINAPLYAGSWESGNSRDLNVNASIHYWLAQGAPAEKLVLGIPLYGRTFTLDDRKKIGVGAPARQPGAPGPYTRQAGTLGYNEICEKFKAEKWRKFYQKDQRVPYAVKGDQWIGYEDAESIKEKAEYINSLGLGGVMVWSVETDDFRGICGERYPLLKTLNQVLNQESTPTPTSATPSQSTKPPVTQSTTSATQSSSTKVPTTEVTSTTESDSCDLVCRESGYLRDPLDCGTFYNCVENGASYSIYEFSCPSGLYFDLASNTCNWPYLVDCSTCK